VTFAQAREREKRLLAVLLLERQIGNSEVIAEALRAYKLARLERFSLSGQPSKGGKHRRRKANAKRRAAMEKAEAYRKGDLPRVP
jgi:hypothetical protein